MNGLIQHPHSIAVIGNYLPRKCGIATFTHDLCEALSLEIPASKRIAAIAMNDIDEGYDYPERVKFVVRDNMQSDYLRAAEFLNINQVEAVILQHEYGIFGGKCGAHIFHLLQNLRMPIIATLHTVLSDPGPEEKSVIAELGRLCEYLIVMTGRGKEFLKEIYGIAEQKIEIIPHGIPDVPFVDSCFYKDQFGVENRKVILTFGLLGPDKGVEYMIAAMPEIIKEHPDAVYVILGATHPHIVRAMGEKYRHELQQLVQRKGLARHVIFHNRFVDLQMLVQFITAADIYVTPYLKKEQIVSGTLSYALGAGKAVVSTPYWHAQELLQEERGIIVPEKDSAALAQAVISLLSNDARRNSMRKKAYQYTRPMVWKEVARSYLQLVHKSIERHIQKPRAYRIKIKHQQLDSLPAINLNHLGVLTDDTGILQHAFFSIPNPQHGYTLDDNARALIAASRHYRLRKDQQMVVLMKRYLAFMINAFDGQKGCFRNVMSYDRRWCEAVGSEDAHGRALWALGVAIKAVSDRSLRDMMCRLFIDSIGQTRNFKYPRAWAFTLIGIHHYLKVFGGDATVRKVREQLAEKLYRVFQQNAGDDWPWFEDILTYDNARLPQALVLTGADIKDEKMVGMSLDVLDWLLQLQTDKAGHLSVIGNDGWMTRNGKRARFAQQPVEVMALTEACTDAYRITKERRWLKEARRCFEWFIGKNDLNIPVYNYENGGCHDGLESNGVNENMGAESTLSWLISLLTMHEVLGEQALIQEQSHKASDETRLAGNLAFGNSAQKRQDMFVHV